MIEWKLKENEQNMFEFQKGMYFIGDLTCLYMDVGGDNISYGEIFNKKQFLIKIKDLKYIKTLIQKFMQNVLVEMDILEIKMVIPIYKFLKRKKFIM